MADGNLPELLDSLDVQRVVVVDDQFTPRPTVMLAWPDGEGPELEGLPPLPEGADYVEHVREHWPAVPIAEKLRAKNLARDVDGTDQQEPDPTGLRDLIGSRPFHGMTLHEWEQVEEQQLRTRKRALILFDVNFTDEGPDRGAEEGLHPAGRALRENTNHIVGLLTTQTSDGDEDASAEAWAPRAGVGRSDLVVVNKNFIDDPGDDERIKTLVEQIRKTLQASQLRQLRETVHAALQEGLDEAGVTLQQRSPTALEDLVFKVSLDGGEWEGDTWFRLYETLGLHRARRAVALNEQARSAICDVRTLLQARSEKAHDGSQALAREVQAAESYDDADYINAAGLPVANGDIFQAGTGPAFILVGQPCDLTLHVSGRSRSPQTATLLPIKQREADDETEPSSYRLPDGSPLEGDGWEVRFRPEHHVSFDVLDLVSFNKEGRATLAPAKGTALSPLLPGLQARHREITKVHAGLVQPLAKIDELKQAKHLSAATATQLRRSLLNGGGPFKATLSSRPTPFAFDCRRIGRLSGTYADALLAAHSGARSRTAHAHELTRIVNDAPE